MIRNFNFAGVGIGGIEEKFNQILRRVFVQLIYSRGIIEKLGVKNVKGIILYGPLGTDKNTNSQGYMETLPRLGMVLIYLISLSDKSEEIIRNLLKEAEEEWELRKKNCALHIIIFDEIDATCKRRGESNVGDQMVNQLLRKIDGPESTNNILIIGTTNRLDRRSSTKTREI